MRAVGRAGWLGWGSRGVRKQALIIAWVAVVGCIAWAAVARLGSKGAVSGSSRFARVAPRLRGDAKSGLSSLPVGLEGLASATLGAESRRFAIARTSSGDLSASGGGISSTFGRWGPTV